MHRRLKKDWMSQAVARDGNVWEWRVVGPAEWLAWSTGNGTLDNVPPGSVEAIYASYVLQVYRECREARAGFGIGSAVVFRRCKSMLYRRTDFMLRPVHAVGKPHSNGTTKASEPLKRSHHAR